MIYNHLSIREKKCFVLKTFRVMKNKNSQKVKKCEQCIFASTGNRTLVFQKSIDNNKSIDVTIYRCQI